METMIHPWMEAVARWYLEYIAPFFFGLLYPPVGFITGRSLFSWPYLLAALIIAYLCFRYQSKNTSHKKFSNFMQWREVFLHPSAILDYKYIFIINGLQLAFIVPLVFSGILISKEILEIMEHYFGENTSPAHAGFSVILLYSFIALLMIDLANYVAHYLYHRVPFLWEFHKTHHAAEVLVPPTAHRKHPIEHFIEGSMTTVTLGVPLGVFMYFYGEIDIYKIAGINIFAVITSIVGGNLRHSHIWFSYGKFLEHFISSPAQHQIHHSTDPKHYNKNFAVHFSFWDWVFGTLHTTTSTPENITFGLGKEGREYHTIRSLLVTPFIKCWKNHIYCAKKVKK